ncbi:hypothetical protein Syun_019625 [Stephania yunnanensis]|uniref:Uncharacterized protein n=1 Tax=Stephania yunnanensis TaxID=152371 RepID=A0AAP0IUI4_9MAGN
MTRKCDATRLKECLLPSMHGVQSIVSHPWWLEENIIPRPRMHIFRLTWSSTDRCEHIINIIRRGNLSEDLNFDLY